MSIRLRSSALLILPIKCSIVLKSTTYSPPAAPLKGACNTGLAAISSLATIMVFAPEYFPHVIRICPCKRRSSILTRTILAIT
uniref:Uncharacterized protein n=1 Tax=Yersinia enterocolitica TaxID=630 RepID=B0RKS1_YEREN|nr:hypothetical protein [Yersinia enterocolitica]